MAEEEKEEKQNGRRRRKRREWVRRSNHDIYRRIFADEWLFPNLNG